MNLHLFLWDSSFRSAEMEKGKEHFDAIFDIKGAFIRKTEPTTNEEDKD